MGGGQDVPIGRRLPESTPVRADEEHDSAQAVADMLVHAAGGQPGQRAGDAGHERLEAEALGKPALGPAAALSLDQEADDEAGLSGEHDERHRDVPSILLPERTLAVEHPAAGRQAPLVEAPPVELAPVEERHVRGGAAQGRAGHRLASERAQRERACLAPHRLEVDHGSADDAEAHRGAEQGEQGAVRGRREGADDVDAIEPPVGPIDPDARCEHDRLRREHGEPRQHLVDGETGQVDETEPVAEYLATAWRPSSLKLWSSTEAPPTRAT